MGIFDRFFRGTRVEKKMEDRFSYKKYIHELRSKGDPFSEFRRNKVLPEKYQPGMNCFFDSIEYEYRQAVYEKIKRIPDSFTIRTYEEMLSLFTVNLRDAMKAYNEIASEPHVVFKLTREELIRWKLEDEDQEIAVLSKDKKHIERINLRNITLDSDPWLNKGNELYEKCKYKESIEYYDKAIEAELLDARALGNKGMALFKLKKYRRQLIAVTRRWS